MTKDELRRNALVIEYMVDRLFDDGPRAHVARLVCKGPPLSPGRVQEITRDAKNKFPGDFEAARTTSMVNMVMEVSRAINDFLSDEAAVAAMMEDLGLGQKRTASITKADVEAGLFDGILARPMSRFQPLTDDEAELLYRLSGVPCDDSITADQAPASLLSSLRNKGYIESGSAKITGRGRKVVIEMATHEPCALEIGKPRTPYSKIKASAKRRERQTFVKKAGLEARTYNHRRMVEAGFGDWMQSVVNRVQDWNTRMSVPMTGQAFKLMRKVYNLVPGAQRALNTMGGAIYSGTAINGADLTSPSHRWGQRVDALLKAMEDFRTYAASKGVAIEPVPRPGAGRMDWNGFSRFYTLLKIGLGAISNDTAYAVESGTGGGNIQNIQQMPQSETELGAIAKAKSALSEISLFTNATGAPLVPVADTGKIIDDIVQEMRPIIRTVTRQQDVIPVSHRIMEKHIAPIKKAVYDELGRLNTEMKDPNKKDDYKQNYGEWRRLNELWKAIYPDVGNEIAEIAKDQYGMYYGRIQQQQQALNQQQGQSQQQQQVATAP